MRRALLKLLMMTFPAGCDHQPRTRDNSCRAYQRRTCLAEINFFIKIVRSWNAALLF
jgi:hypothetical protein